MLVTFPVEHHERYETNIKISEHGQWYYTKHSFTEGKRVIPTPSHPSLGSIIGPGTSKIRNISIKYSAVMVNKSPVEM
jgi:hypothetical protein